MPPIDSKTIPEGLLRPATRLELPFSGKWQTETKPIGDTNKMTTTETKYQTDFILPKNTNRKPNFNKAVLKSTDKIPRKCQEIWDINTKYRFGIGIFLVYQIIGYRLTSLNKTSPGYSTIHSEADVKTNRKTTNPLPEVRESTCTGQKRTDRR